MDNFELENGKLAYIGAGGSPRTAGFGYDKKSGRWRTPFPSCAIRLMKNRSMSENDKKLVRLLQKKRASRHEESAFRDSCINSDEVLRPFQRAGLDYIILGDNIILADEMGLGKTVQAIAYFNHLAETKGSFKALVICPASLKINWKRECEKFLKTPQTIRIINSGAPIYAFSSITIINYDIIGRYEEVRENSFDVLVLDEAHYLKNKSAARTKAVFGTNGNGAISAEKIIAITGTPIENRPSEFFSILKALEPFGFPNARRFQQRYCEGRMGRMGWDASGASNTDELSRKIRSTVMIRRLKKDVAKDLPEKQRSFIHLDLKLSKAQKDLAKMDVAELLESTRPGSLNGVHVATARKELGEMKIKPACVFVEDMLQQVEKVIIFCIHRSVVDGMVETLKGYKPVHVYGGMTEKKKQQAVDLFQNGSARVFIGNVQAAGVGLTLTASSDIVMAESSWKPGENRQAEDRAHRIGQKKNVSIQYLVVNNSIDSKVALSNLNKEKVLNSLLGGFENDERKNYD